MTFKAKVSKPGFNVLTETNPDNLIFSSDYNTLKYYASGSYQMANVTTTTNVTIAHNLGYMPFFIVYVNDFFAQPTQYAEVEYLNSVGGLKAARAYVDANNLYLSYNSGDANPYTINWYYKIFKNSLGL